MIERDNQYIHTLMDTHIDTYLHTQLRGFKNWGEWIDTDKWDPLMKGLYYSVPPKFLSFSETNLQKTRDTPHITV